MMGHPMKSDRWSRTILSIFSLSAVILLSCRSNQPTELESIQYLDLQYRPPGFYKDLFVDAGVGLTKLISLPAADYMGLTYEFVLTEDAEFQNQLIIGDVDDLNGILLYPDGDARFRLFYSNGGSSVTHGLSLTENGLERVRAFYRYGGSYTGSCAGSALFSLSREESGIMDCYYHLWPGRVCSVPLSDAYPEHTIPQASPLLQYHSFGDDNFMGPVRFNKGNYAREDFSFPFETEILLRYFYPSTSLHEMVSCWAYKRRNTTGRGVVIGCHPEAYPDGEQLLLMEAMLLYAMDGVGEPTLKGTLEDDIWRIVDKSTTENDPEYTKIGDKQYHHFKVQIPDGVNNLTVTLDGEEEYHLNLYIEKDGFAFEETHDFSDQTVESDKTIMISNPSPGEWYIGVECYTTVIATYIGTEYLYSGSIEVLNGVAYSILAEWE